MFRLFVVVLFSLLLLPGLSSAVELDNIRLCFGPFGATRKSTKCLPGDVIFMTYDISGLAIDPKTKKANYTTTLELAEINGANEKVLFKNPTPNVVVPQLGTTRMPGDLNIVLGPKQAPGLYAIRLTVKDENGNASKRFTQQIEVVKEGLGFVGVSAPAVGFPGQHYVTGFGLVNMKLDGKGEPDAELTLRILDDKGKQVGDVVKWTFPRDLPAQANLKQANFVPMSHAVFLNRSGRFTIEVEATDKGAKTTASMRYPVTVIDLNSIVK